MTASDREAGTIPWDGICDDRFRGVRDAFVDNLAGADLGAGVSVWLDGEQVVNLWGGFREEARSTPWVKDTLAFVASSTKPFTGVCLLQLLEEGKVSLDAPVATYWPEFRGGGKDAVTVRHIMSHRGGLPAISADYRFEDYFDWPKIIQLLEAQATFWPAGMRHGYHPTTYGFLVGEVVRRMSGVSLGRYLREHVCGPLGLDFHVGLAEADLGRCAENSFAEPGTIAPTPAFEALMQRAAVEGSITQLAFAHPPAPVGVTNLPALRRAEMPGSNGHGTAEAVGRFYACLSRGGELDGVRILQPETVALATEEQAFGEDATLGITSRFGLGVMLRHDGFPIGPSPRAFGHSGAGGSLGFADPGRRLGFGYVMNRGKPSGFGSPTAYRLVEALYRAL